MGAKRPKSLVISILFRLYSAWIILKPETVVPNTKSQRQNKKIFLKKISLICKLKLCIEFLYNWWKAWPAKQMVGFWKKNDYETE